LFRSVLKEEGVRLVRIGKLMVVVAVQFIIYFVVIFCIEYTTFNLLNYIVAKRSPSEYHNLKIIKAGKGHGKNADMVRFIFEGKEESLYIDSRDIAQIALDEGRLKKSGLYLETRKGIMGAYIIEEWDIVSD
ncbi:MAG TPA: hypothetical protein VEC37_10155, partial [Bacillota bacterium]|nr:hypothetical protein [Bacillota bacterium]